VTPLDRLIRSLRERQARPHIPRGARVLDVGCADGNLLRGLGPHNHDSVGIDTEAVLASDSTASGGRYRLMRGRFPDDLGEVGQFDVITMLAVFEHFPDADRPRVVDACRRLLRAGGRVVVTVPAPAVDRIVDVLVGLRLADGIDIASHHGYDPERTPLLFSGFRVARHERFELGLNHLFALER
jgi:2-polyprenyl-3-methyl-5-hydroxy-6-metoxy-1,4-benzoquinol methylase